MYMRRCSSDTRRNVRRFGWRRVSALIHLQIKKSPKRAAKELRPKLKTNRETCARTHATGASVF